MSKNWIVETAAHAAAGVFVTAILFANLDTRADAQQAFQGTENKVYQFTVSIPSLPTVYMANGPRAQQAQAWGIAAIKAKNNCDPTAFEDAMDHLRFIKSGFDLDASFTEDDDKRNPPPGPGVVSIIYQGLRAVFAGHDIDRPDKAPSAKRQRELNDGNTVASIIVWLQQKPYKNCEPPETGYFTPPPPTGTATFYVGGGLIGTSSKTKVGSPTDTQTKGDPTTQAILFGEFDLGPWFVTGQTTFAGTPHGNFSDVFPAFPAADFTATVNSGQLYSFVGDAGYSIYNGNGLKVGVFGGYYAYDEFDYGTFPGFAATFPILATQWRAGEGGMRIAKMFQVGSVPFDFNVTAAGQYDHLRAGMFSGNGGGVRINGSLSFPLGPVKGNIFAQYTDLNASGSNTGVPLTFNTQTWYVGAGISIGGPSAASSASMVLKAPPK
jgi:hypothetical protein